jgi:YggT family protein
VITLLIIVHVVLTYVMSPYHPIRQFIDSLVEPLLAPIRRLMPRTGMFDFSPLVLMILVQLVSSVLVNLLIAR